MPKGNIILADMNMFLAITFSLQQICDSLILTKKKNNLASFEYPSS